MPFLTSIASNGVPATIDWPDDYLLPGDGGALRIDADAQAVDVRRPVVAAAHVVLARPDDLDRRARRLRDLNRLGDDVARRGRAAAEAAAQEHRVDLDLLGRDAEDLRRRHLVHRLELRAGPDLALAVVRCGRCSSCGSMVACAR